MGDAAKRDRHQRLRHQEGRYMRQRGRSGLFLFLKEKRKEEEKKED